jgi:hypothetical protein
MLARILGLFIFSTALSPSLSSAQDDYLANLESRIHHTPRVSLMRSFTNHSQSYIYDQALAIIAFARSGHQKIARTLLHTLAQLQLKDGSLYFSYYLNGKSPYPHEEGDKRYAGAIAWVALAAVTYQKQFSSDEFISFNRKVLDYLEKQLRPFKTKQKTLWGIPFGPSDIAQTSWNENEIGALEHNLDAYAAFLNFASLNQHKHYSKLAAKLEDFIMNLWDKSSQHFWSGVNFKTGLINKDEFYLDNQTWSLLALNENMLKKINPHAALSANCHALLVEDQGVRGFLDMKPSHRDSPFSFVWSEGSAGQVLAMKKINKLFNNQVKCKDLEVQTLLDNIKKMKQDDGGIAYATSDKNPDFNTASSVAGTAWYYFALKDINPFEFF